MDAGCEVVVERGGRADCLHRVAICATDGDGSPSAATPGAVGLAVFLRSSAKPFQAAPAVAADVLDPFGLGDRHLAVACASHTGLDEPSRLAAEMLSAAGLGAADLRCGHDGAHDGVRHNCSGNHALALAHCVARGWDPAGYLDADHPVQREMRRAVIDAAGATPGEAGDGCGMRAYHLPLERFAAMFGRLAAAGAQTSLGRCAAAMRAYPHLVREPGAIDTELMRAQPGLVAKIGAEGVIGIGLADGRGLALKVIDGDLRAVGPAAVAAVRAAFGMEPSTAELQALACGETVDNRGVKVGSITGHAALQAP